MLRSSFFFSLSYNLLLSAWYWRRLPLLSKIWNTLWRWQIHSYKGLVKSKLHGKSVILTNGHWYSLVCRMYPKFNQPLFSLVEAITKDSDRKIKVIDVGAAVGDTVLFLEANFPTRIANYLCIDGDSEFYSFQAYNLKSVAHKSKNVFSLLSDKEELVSAIDKKDPTTGSAIGESKEMSKTLDKIVEDTNFGGPDIIKVDIDGFDGKAIGGGTETLKKFKPAVIFEWNTPLYNLVENDVLQPFEVLQACGYNRFIWFSNLGNFLYCQFGFNPLELKEMEAYSNSMYKVNGYHYDVIALHGESPLKPMEIAFINETTQQISPY